MQQQNSKKAQKQRSVDTDQRFINFLPRRHNILILDSKPNVHHGKMDTDRQ